MLGAQRPDHVLPLQVDVEVPPAGLVAAYDELGQARIEEPDVLQTWSRNDLAEILPPGDYALSVDVGDRGSAQRTVTVRAGSAVTVNLRF